MPENGSGNDIDHLQISIEANAAKAAMGIERLALALGTLKTSTSGVSEMLSGIVDSLQKLSQTNNISVKVKVFEEIGTTGAESAKKATTNFSALSRALSTLAKPFNKAAAAAGSFLKKLGSRVIHAFTGRIERLATGVYRLFNSIRRVVLMRAIRAVLREITAGFKEGIDNLYQWSAAVDGRFKASMDQIATSMLYLKNSIAAMVSPIINRLAPAIDYLVDRFVDLLNIVNQVFSALTGNNTWTKAIKYPVEYAEGMADAAKSTKEAAKELKLFLLPFDELNVLTKDNPADTSTPGSAGQGGLNYAEMFETRELEDWAKKIKDLIDQGDWYGAGAALAEHLNGIIEQWDSYAWGEILAEKLNNAISFALGFMRTFEWDTLGERVSQFLRGIIETLNWEDLGALLASKWNALFGFLGGFFRDFSGTDLGVDLGVAFNAWVEEINWGMIGETVNEGVNDILDGIIAFLETSDTEELGAGIQTMMDKIKWDDIMSKAWEAAKLAIKKTWNLGGDIVEAIWENGDTGKLAVIASAFLGVATAIGKVLSIAVKLQPIISALIKLFGGGATVGAGAAGAGAAGAAGAGAGAGAAAGASGAAGGLAGALAAAAPWIIGIAGTVAYFAATFLLLKKSFEDTKKGWEDIKRALSEDGVFDWISEKANALWTWIQETWANISTWVDENVIQPVKAVIEPIVEWISTAFEGAWIIVKAAWIIASEWFDEKVIQPIVKLYTDIKEKIVSFLTEAWTRVKAVWAVVSEWFDNKVIQPIIKLYNNVKEKVVGFFTEAWNRVKSVWNVVASWFSANIISPLVSAFSTAATFISNVFSSVFSFIRSLAAAVINGVIGTIEGGINNIISGLNWLIGIFNQVVQVAAAYTGDNWSGLGEIGYVSLGRVDSGVDTSAAYSGIGGNNQEAFGGMVDAIRGALYGGRERSQQIDVTVELDGEKVGRSVVNYVNDQTIANGQSPMYAY